jgi:glucose-6-phosphate 1-dehydrogenase
LLPSLHGLERDGLLPASLRILGCARSALERDAFRAQVAESIIAETPAGDRTEQSVARLLARLDYVSVDLADSASMAALFEHITRLRTAMSCFTCPPRQAGMAPSVRRSARPAYPARALG